VSQQTGDAHQEIEPVVLELRGPHKQFHILVVGLPLLQRLLRLLGAIEEDAAIGRYCYHEDGLVHHLGGERGRIKERYAISTTTHTLHPH